jgi:hypothetical protein
LRSNGDQSGGQIMRLSTAGFHLRQQVNEGKRDSRRRGWSALRSNGDQSGGQIMRLSTAGFHLRQQVNEGKRDS